MSIYEGPTVIVALDFPSRRRALRFAHELNPDECAVKVGLELFIAEGPAIIRSLNRLGFKVFLDLKIKDIPNTAVGAVRAAMKHGVWMINFHADGGFNMLEAVFRAVNDIPNRPKIIAVTVLTSMDSSDLREAGVSIRTKRSTTSQVLRLARLVHASGLDGVVASAEEARILRQEFGEHFLIATPGIRLPGGNAHDQKRVMTPGRAIIAGSDYLVVGRPITESKDPRGALDHINNLVRNARYKSS